MSLTVDNNISRRLSTHVPIQNSASELDLLLEHVGRHFRVLLDEKANTLETALELMDSSSIGKARYMEEFEQLQANLKIALKRHVNDNYQGFNSAIGSYRSVVEGITDSQNNIEMAKRHLTKARSDLASRRPALKELRQKSLHHGSMLDTLELIELLKSVPDKLEQHIARKEFLSAYSTLSEAVALADNEQLIGISALQPLQTYLATQHSSLFGILIEELLNHLYLKSPYCSSRWHAYSNIRDDLATVEQVLEDKIRLELNQSSSSANSSQLDDFLASYDPANPPTEGNEEDSLGYIRFLIETISRLNRLPQTFDYLESSANRELKKVVEKTTQEVYQRSPKAFLNTDSDPSAPLNLFDDLSVWEDHAKLSVLKDLMWTLYSKFMAVLQGHRVVYEVSFAIRQGTVVDKSTTNKKDASTMDHDIFSIFEKMLGQIHTIMQSYINADSAANTSSSIVSSKQSKLPSLRSNAKLSFSFKFSSSDPHNEQLKAQFDLLKEKLGETVPGLVSATHIDFDSTSPYVKSSSPVSEQPLIGPNVLNIRALLDPTVVFLQRAKVVLPMVDVDSSVSRKRKSLMYDRFLEDFLNSAFLPQLESCLNTSFNHMMQAYDIFGPDPRWPKLLKRPVSRAATSYMRLLSMTCTLLNTSYMYREKYVSLLTSTIGWIRSVFQARYNELLEKADSTSESGKIAITLSSNPDVLACFERLQRNSPDLKDSLIKERQLYVQKRHNPRSIETAISQTDLLSLSAYDELSLMTTSLRWMAVRLKSMKKIAHTPEAASQESSDTDVANLTSRMKKRWTLLEASHMSSGASDSAQLMLSGASIRDFDNEVTSLVSLADQCILSLRCDIGCRCVFFIDQTMTRGNYRLDMDAEERDTFIGMLNTQLIQCDDSMSSILTTKDRSIVLRELSTLVGDLLIYDAENLKDINLNGYLKMLWNIKALDATLKAVAVDPSEVDLSRPKKFYQLFHKLMNTPNNIINELQSNDDGFSYEEWKILARLTYNQIISNHEHAGKKDMALNTKSAQQEMLAKIHQHFWGSNGVNTKR